MIHKHLSHWTEDPRHLYGNKAEGMGGIQVGIFGLLSLL